MIGIGLFRKTWTTFATAACQRKFGYPSHPCRSRKCYSLSPPHAHTPSSCSTEPSDLSLWLAQGVGEPLPNWHSSARKMPLRAAFGVRPLITAAERETPCYGSS